MNNQRNSIKQHKLKLFIFISLFCPFFFSSTLFADIAIGPIGYHWVAYDNGCVPPVDGQSDYSCDPDPAYQSPLPDTLLVGVRVCNLSISNSVSNLKVTFSWDPNKECYAQDPDDGDPYDYSVIGGYSSTYCRADRIWLESMEGVETIGSAAAWAWTETKDCDMQSGGSCTSWTLPIATEGVYWDRYDDMEEMADFGDRAIDPPPGSCRDVYFNVSADLAELADLDNSGDPLGSVPIQIKATGDGVQDAFLTYNYGSWWGYDEPPLDPLGPDDDPDNDVFGAAVDSFLTFPDTNEASITEPYFNGPTSVTRGNEYTYTFGWVPGSLSVMHTILDFPDDLYDIVHVKTEGWYGKTNFISNNTSYLFYTSNSNVLDFVRINDNWFHTNFHSGFPVSTWGGDAGATSTEPSKYWGTFGKGIGDPDGYRPDLSTCTWPGGSGGVDYWPLDNTTAGFVCNYKRAFIPPYTNRECFAQESSCNVNGSRDHFFVSTYTVRAKRDIAADDVIKWAMVYTEGSESFKYWYFVDEITYATVEDFRAYEGDNGVVVEWQTSSEIGTAGYKLYRYNPTRDKYKKISKRLLPALPGSGGGVYRFVDRNAVVGESYTYKLVEVEIDGDKNRLGPYTVTVEADAAQGATQPADEKIAEFNHKPRELSKKDKRLNSKARESRKLAKKKKKQRRGERAKLLVDKPGVYHLNTGTVAELLNISSKKARKFIKNKKLALRNKGRTVPLFSTKNGNEGVYFYGEAENSNYTNENVYWLKSAKKKGRKGATIVGAVAGKNRNLPAQPASLNFQSTLKVEENNWALPALYNDPESDYWMWDYIIAGSSDKQIGQYQVATPSPDVSGSASVSIRFRGGYLQPENGSHHAKISVNDHYIGEFSFKDPENSETELSFSASFLNDGVNTIRLDGSLNGETTDSIFYLNSFTVQYDRLYKAVDEQLVFMGSSDGKVIVDGFTSSRIFVFDISDPSTPRPVKAKQFSSANGGFKIVLARTNPAREYIAVGKSGLSTVADAYQDTPSQLKKSRNRADYVVIAPAELMDGARRLAEYRSSTGLLTRVVELEDVMDDFNFGIYSPEAIRQFMIHANTDWSKAPQYLVLLGNGTYDYKDVGGFGDNLLPVRMVSSDYGLTSSDTSFGDLTGNDGIPEVAVGRIPARTADELNSYINKLIAMEETSGHGARSKVLMLADKSSGEGANFSSDSDLISALMPKEFVIEKVHVDDLGLDASRTAAIDAINNGVGFVNYNGHAGITQIGMDGLLKMADVDSLVNLPFTPVMTLWTCAVGKTELPGYRGIAEELMMAPAGGASAIFAPSSLVDSKDSERMGKYFYDNVLSLPTGEETIGKLIIKTKELYGKESKTGLSLLYLYNLLGDPAMSIQ